MQRMTSNYEDMTDWYDHNKSSPNFMPSENNDFSQKVDDILKLVRSIDQRLKNRADQPSLPPNREENKLTARAAPFPVREKINRAPDLPLPPTPPAKPDLPLPPTPPAKQSYANLPPPRPPKSVDMIEPVIAYNGEMTFTASQTLCLVLQLKAVRLFIDQNFDDEYVDKEINMAVLDSVLRTLSTKKN